jgi:hypothetical protein
VTSDALRGVIRLHSDRQSVPRPSIIYICALLPFSAIFPLDQPPPCLNLTKQLSGGNAFLMSRSFSKRLMIHCTRNRCCMLKWPKLKRGHEHKKNRLPSTSSTQPIGAVMPLLRPDSSGRDYRRGSLGSCACRSPDLITPAHLAESVSLALP